MQVNRLGIALIALFMLGGIGLMLIPVSGSARLTFVMIGGIWALVAGGLLLYAIRQRRRAQHEDWVFRTGTRGRATVVSASSSGTVNEMPLMKLELDLEIPGHPRRQVKRRLVMSLFAAQRMRPGLVLPVYANPGDPDDFVLVW